MEIDKQIAFNLVISNGNFYTPKYGMVNEKVLFKTYYSWKFCGRYGAKGTFVKFILELMI